MTKPGHEAPLLDNKNPADLSPHALEEQLRIGQDEPEPEKKTPEIPTGLKLTDDEEERVARLMQTEGLDRGTAIRYTASRSTSRRIDNHAQSSRMAAKLGTRIEKKQQETSDTGLSTEKLHEILRSTYSEPKQGAEPTESTSQ